MRWKLKQGYTDKAWNSHCAVLFPDFNANNNEGVHGQILLCKERKWANLLCKEIKEKFLTIHACTAHVESFGIKK